MLNSLDRMVMILMMITVVATVMIVLVVAAVVVVLVVVITAIQIPDPGVICTASRQNAAFGLC